MSRSPGNHHGSLASLLLALLAAPSASAHRSLYHEIEIHFPDSAHFTCTFIIHAPELPWAVRQGVDPSAADKTWLQARTPSELARLQAEARALIRQGFHFRLASGAALHLERRLSFDPSPPPAANPAPEGAAPPACLVASARVPLPGPPHRLALSLDPSSAKRLLLVVNRPGAFPETRDLAPGDSASLDLPAPPRKPFLWSHAAAALLLLIAASALAIRWRVHPRSDR